MTDPQHRDAEPGSLGRTRRGDAPSTPASARDGGLPSARDQTPVESSDAGQRPKGGGRGRGRSGSARGKRGERRGKPRTGGGGSRDGRAKPTPVRSLLDVEPAPAAPPPDVPQVDVEVGGEPWTVRVLGRGGDVAGGPPLLLLGFWRADSSEGEPERESLVVSRALSSLSHEQLVAAQRGSRPPAEARGGQGFFATAADRRRR